MFRRLHDALDGDGYCQRWETKNRLTRRALSGQHRKIPLMVAFAPGWIERAVTVLPTQSCSGALGNGDCS
jgi:hypothetical protein